MKMKMMMTMVVETSNINLSSVLLVSPQVHLPSLNVFSNFPVSKKKMVYRASCLDFSPHSGFFSLANDKGRAPLFR